MKIVVFTSVYKRFELTKLFFENLKRQGIDVYCSCSSDEELKMYKNYCKGIVKEPNNPVSDKFNSAIKLLKDVQFDYAMILGSDDFVCDDMFKLLPHVIKSDYFAFNDIYFYRVKDKKTVYAKMGNVVHAPIGAGSMFSKALLEKMKYRLFSSGLNKWLDSDRHKLLSHKGFECQVESIKDLGVEMVDVKHSYNITDMDMISVLDDGRLEKINLKQFNNLPKAELEHIKFKEPTKDKMENKKRIQITEDYLDLKKGMIFNVQKPYANGLIEKGIAKEIDGDVKASTKKETPKSDKDLKLNELREKYPGIKANSKAKFLKEIEKLSTSEHDCEDCKDDEPCEGCEKSAETTNIPDRKKK